MTRHVLNKAPTACGSTFPKDPWDWNIYLHEWWVFMAHEGAYSSLTGPNQLVLNVYHGHFHLSKVSGFFLSFPKEKNGAGVLLGEFHHSVGGKKRCEPVAVGSLSHYLQGFIHPRWCRIASIDRSKRGAMEGTTPQKARTMRKTWTPRASDSKLWKS